MDVKFRHLACLPFLIVRITEVHLDKSKYNLVTRANDDGSGYEIDPDIERELTDYNPHCRNLVPRASVLALKLGIGGCSKLLLLIDTPSTKITVVM